MPHTIVEKYYEEAAYDFQSWSRHLNIHCGYFNGKVNPFHLESMLDQMNEEVLRRLQVTNEDKGIILDLGCGLGATMRHAARLFPEQKVKGLTITPWQVWQNQKIAEKEGLNSQVETLHADFNQIPFPENSLNGAYAIESICYAEGFRKEKVIQEAARTLKPGKRLVVADVFLKDPQLRFNPIQKYCYRCIRENWVFPEMPQLHQFVECLEENGFEVKTEEISWAVAPSVAHVPLVILKFILGNWLRGKRMTQNKWSTVKASFVTMPIGMSRNKFGYYFVSAKKR